MSAEEEVVEASKQPDPNAPKEKLFENVPQFIEHIAESITFTPFETKWVPSSAKFVLLGINPKGTGALHLYELNKLQAKTIAKSEKEHGFKCGTFAGSPLEDRFLATGDYGGNMAIWDLDRLSSPVFNVKAHSSIVNCIDGCGGMNIGYGAPEIVTGSRDGCVRVWDPRQQDPVASLEPAQGHQPRDCWTVAFGNSYNDEERCVAAGYDNGDIKLLDLRMNKLRWEVNVGDGIVNLEFDRKDILMNKLVATTLESRFLLYDMRTQHPQDGYASMSQKAHNSTIWLAKHLPQNREILMTCGGDGSLNLYKYHYPAQRKIKDENGVEKGVTGSLELLNTKKVAELPVVSFDWNRDREGLCVMASVDQHVRVASVTKLNKY